MEVIEIVLLIAGLLVFVLSFVIPAKVEADTKEEAFATLIDGINELQIMNPLIIDATLLNDVFSTKDTAHELQVYVGDLV